jgi:cation diffusion facilitator family transporter
MYLAGWLSIAVNIVLFGLKYWAGFSSGSVAIIADAWHTLSDSLTSIIVIVGLRLALKPEDKEHPFGHGRVELIASIIIAVLLAVVGVNFFIESIHKLERGERAVFGMLPLIVFAVSVLFKEAIAQFAFSVAKKSGSRSLRADGWHHRSDAVASALILIGVFLGRYFWWIDGVLGILVALLILYAAFDILKEGAGPLIGEKPDDNLVEAVQKTAETVIPGDAQVHHLHMHRYGEHTEVTFHVRLSSSMTVADSDHLVEKIENRLRSELHVESTIRVESASG